MSHHQMVYGEAEASLRDTRIDLEAVKQKGIGLTQCQKEVNTLAALCQNQSQASVAAIVTRCIDFVFGPGRYTFSLDVVEKRGQTEVSPVLTDSEGNSFNPLKEVGGGVIDVVAFGLRVAVLTLSRPRPSPVLLLDEPFRFVSEQYRGRIVSLLDTLAKEHGIQIIMVTHIQEYVGGNIINIG